MVPPGEGRTGVADPMTEMVLQLCDAAASAVVPAARAELAALRAELTEPLRVAVVGRVSTGKSTLVNALIGRRVAPTAAGECTRVVTWYRFGAPDRAELVLRDGTVHPLPFDGALPATLAVDPDRALRIEVRLQSGPLRHLTLIDTPGLGSPDRPDGDDAAGGEASVLAAEQAGALLYLFRDVEKRDDIGFIEAYRAATGAGSSVAAVIGVLAQADVFGPGPWSERDPLSAAGELATRIGRDHPVLLGAVVPVAGLLAEAARTGLVTEAGARTLAALAAVEDARLPLLPRFGLPTGVDAAAVARLLAELGPYPIARGRGVAGGGAAALQAWLLERSGIAAVEDLLAHRFVRRGRPLTVERVLRRLRELARSRAVEPAAASWLRDRVEHLELAPQLHRMLELRARRRLVDCRGPVAAQVAAELDLMIDNDELWRQLGVEGPRPVAALTSVLHERWERAQGVVGTARDPRVGDAARVLTRSYALAADRAGPRGGEPAVPREHPGPGGTPRF